MAKEIKITPNLAWLFYKDYYLEKESSNFFWKKHTIKDKKALEKAEKAHFNEKNNVLLRQKTICFEKEELPQTNTSFELCTGSRGFLIGISNTHSSEQIGEFKLGLQLHHTFGMPYIPGSSVKGMLRSAFLNEKRKLKLGTRLEGLRLEQLCTATGLDEATIAPRIIAYLNHLGVNNPTVLDAPIRLFFRLLENRLFEGTQPKIEKGVWDGKSYAPIRMRQRSIFYDVFPSSKKEQPIFEQDVLTPHRKPLKNPVPLPFLKVAANVPLGFGFDLYDNALLSIEEQTKLFIYLLTEIGIGAKHRYFGKLELNAEDKEKQAVLERLRPQTINFEGATINFINVGKGVITFKIVPQPPYTQQYQEVPVLPKAISAYQEAYRKKPKRPYTLILNVSDGKATWHIKEP